MDYNNLKTSVEIIVSCKDLPSLDTFSKSDAMVVIFLQDSKTHEYKEMDRSEILKDNENPQFQKKFVLDYFFEELQNLKFQVYDADAESKDLSKHDFIGEMNITLGDLVAAPGRCTKQGLKDKQGKPIKKGTIRVNCETVGGQAETLILSLGAQNLDKKDFFGSSDPFVQIFRPTGDDGKSWMKVCETEYIKNNVNPRWKPLRISMQALCNGDYSRKIQIKVFDWDGNGKYELIGECETPVSFFFQQPPPAIRLDHPEKIKKPKYTGSGQLLVVSSQIEREYGFLDYVAGGCQISLMVAIDYTGSNGDPNSRDSLHSRHQFPNQYQQAISVIGNIVAPYDSDQRYPVWGFGGNVGGVVSHCFPLTFNNQQIEVQGIEGIMQAYNNSFSRVALSGPTYFSQVIAAAAEVASRPYTQQSQHYSILLIITDGIINDMQQTIQRLVSASNLPLSVVIIGVGEADFKQMEQLDGDGGVLVADGIPAKRDIVQFVPLRDYRNNAIAQLARDTLAEVPKQFLSHMKANKIAPLPPRQYQEAPHAQAPAQAQAPAPMSPAPAYI